MSANALGRVEGTFDADRNFDRLWTLFETDGAAAGTARNGGGR